MTTTLILCTVAALEVAVVLSVMNSLPRRHWLRLGFTKLFPPSRKRKHT